ncbi:MAG TPA: hypothetical protein VKU89_01345 [Solirubrobacteraceae bacterium]|nr:hypothetical protein [Solirubrobacteraceae bacterium]
MAPRVVICAAASFSETLAASACARALAAGIAAAAPELDVQPHALEEPGEEPGAILCEPAAIRALVLAAPGLGGRPQPTEPAFLLASTARQGGIPAYGVSALREPDRFYARMLDLQLIIPAATRPALTRAGRRLGRILIEQFR